MCVECRQNPCHPRCPNAEPIRIQKIAVGTCERCGVEIYPGDWYFEAVDETMFCEECLNDLPASDILELCGKSLTHA